MRGDRGTSLARSLRHRTTEVEHRLWGYLRGRRFEGLKFKRQARIGRYVVDFLCPEHHLVIEIDGSQHMRPERAAHDANRTAVLEAMGYVVIRFWSNDVLENPGGVGVAILDQLHRNGLVPPHPVPLPSEERGR